MDISQPFNLYGDDPPINYMNVLVNYNFFRLDYMSVLVNYNFFIAFNFVM